jgi:hypothetical protein
MSGEGFGIWVTGADRGAVHAVADDLAGALLARHLRVEVLDERTPGVEALAGEALAERVALVARLLARHGVVTIVALEAGRRGREVVRAGLGRLIEVLVVAATAGGGGDEAPERPEVEIALPERTPGAGVGRTLRTLELLGLMPAAEDRTYSEEEEREVIRRLKAFGYL